jgi:N-acetylglucosaminyldiphosphoundecaprenol N-acetyl-beta-D-mannosaminyltransferase
VARIFDVAVDCVVETDVIDLVLGNGDGGSIYSVNLDILRQAVRSPEIASLLREGSVRIPDGMPIYWASRLAGQPVAGRVPGSTLVSNLSIAAADAGQSVYLLGGNPGTAEKAAAALTRAAPSLDVVGIRCPPVGFERDAGYLDELVDEIRSTAPAIIYVALGFPKQERLIRVLQDRYPTAWYVSCGITFSFLAGEVRRAPTWVQHIGLEWLHRFAQEPRRLFRRYFVEDLPFAFRLFAWSLAQRRLARAES